MKNRLDHSTFLDTIRLTSHPERSFWWPSQELTANPVAHAGRAMEIIRQVADLNSPLSHELQANFGDLSQMLSPKFWDKYFSTYDLLVAFNAPYRELLKLAHEHLPLSGRILDLGSGTGNFSFGLALQSGHRAFTLLDQSASGLKLAEQKFNSVFDPRSQKIEYVKRSLTDPEAFPRTDAAVMNNVLYSLPTLEMKREVLRKIVDGLPNHGRFFLNDPLTTTGDASFFRQSFIHIVLGAICENSPMTEHDLAVLTFANIRLTQAEGKADQSLFLGIDEMQKLCAEVNLKLLSTRPTYIGVAQAYCLEVNR
jgi:SAM-dependent methyltransferase